MPAECTNTLSRLSFSALSFSKLFQDYTSFSEDIAPFFAGDFRTNESFKKVAEETLTVPRDRETLADVLLDQNARWGLDDATRNNIELLRNPESVVVITGQQLGLYLSPLYIPYKTLTTILLAQKQQKELDRPVVPVFWLAGEDHDFEEVATFTLPSEAGAKRMDYHAASEQGRGPVGRIKLSQQIATLLEEIDTILPASPNKQELMAFLQNTYKPGITFRDAFARMLRRLFKDSGLIIASVDDPKLKKLCIPLFKKEIEEFEEITDALQANSDVLELKYHSQVKINPTNLFLMDDTSRLPVDANNDTFHPRTSNSHLDAEALKKQIEQEPERFSPNVILRPIVQDVLFPNISYVAGPGEIAYYAQMKPSYQWANLPMPVIFPRASITLVEPAIQRQMDHFTYDLTEYREDAAKLFRKHAISNLDLDLDSLFGEATQHVETAVQVLQEAVLSWEASLQKTAGSSRQALLKDLDRFKEQIIKAQKRKMAHTERRIHQIHTHLFPGGAPQERALSPLYFLNQYGLDFFTSLMHEVSLDTTSHQVINL